MVKKQAVLVVELTFLLLLITLGSSSCGEVQELRPDNGVQDGASKGCKQAYGVLPCTTSARGNIFLILVYGYLVFKASKWLTKGSEVLLEINGYGVFGGLFLPLLCSLPGAIIILACGLFGSKESGQSEASIGMGLLAGSSVTLLTLLLGSCVFAGKCDLRNSNGSESSNPNAISLTGSGVVTDSSTSHPVWIMLISIIPFILLLLLQLFLTSHTHLAILISLVFSVSLLLSYCLYQIFEPWIQHRRLAYAMHKRAKCVMLWLTETGEPDREALIKLFKSIDHNSDGYLSAEELRALAFGVYFEDIDSDVNDNVQKLLEQFDTSGDSLVDEDEFVEGMSKLIKDQHIEPSPSPAAARLKHIFHQILLIGGISNWFKEIIHHDEDHQETLLPAATGLKYSHLPRKKRQPLMVNERVESSEDSTRHGSMAILTLLLGTGIVVAFAHPLVDSLHNLSSATKIPPFFISFLILPFVCSSEIVPCLVLASKKKEKIASLIFSEIYREVTMSNILYLSSFLFVVYIRDLAWSFSFEMIIVVTVCVFMGVFAGWRTTFPLWTCLVAYSLYAMSLVLAYVLPIVLGSS